MPAETIVADPLTGALGYGLEYTYSVMERIRSSAFTGDPMLAVPMISNPGYEVSKIKESRALRQDFRCGAMKSSVSRCWKSRPR